MNKLDKLLNKKIPSYRQAYSDRTSWLMSCLSELSYIKFNPLFNNNEKKEVFINNISRLISIVASKKNQKDSKLGRFVEKHAWSKLIGTCSYNHEEKRLSLSSQLKNLHFDLVDTFDRNGTQAILVKNNSFVALAFRGTESTSITDIKNDLDATSVLCTNGIGQVHRGFQKAFEEVFPEIEVALKKEEISNLPLFITGHSLGGGLAIIASKRLKHKAGIAACYTFGSPRVGNTDWSDNMKTPIYRVINSADMVPSIVPPGWIVQFIKWGFSFLPSPLEKIGNYVHAKFGGYYHGGDQRYLTNCPRGNFKDVRLRSRVYFWRFYVGGGLSKFTKKILSDHKINVYREKLLVIALRRNAE